MLLDGRVTRALLALSLTTFLACSGNAADEEGEDTGSDEGALGSLPNTVFYSASRTHSPIAPSVAARLRSVLGDGQRADAFSKIGDSQTVSSLFMHCLTRPVELGVDAPIGGETLPMTIAALLGQHRGARSFGRTSLAAKVGAMASFALGGPLDSEVAQNRPAFAVVMYGSNDIQGAPSGGIETYAKEMLRITDSLIAQGVVPILSSPPPRPLRSYDVAAFGSAGADVWVPRYSAVVRGIAQARQVPFVDLERELRKLDGLGIGPDQLHLNASPRGACRFDDDGLRYGMNVRNLVTINALHRARAATLGKAADNEAPRIEGQGTPDDPFLPPEVPFTDLRALGESHTEATNASADASCAGQPTRFVYRFRTSAAQSIRVGFFEGGSRAARLFVREPGGACRSVERREGALPMSVGEHELVVTSADLPQGARDSEYLLTVTAEHR